MTIYYLYVKTHNITGLKYLGQTKRDPFMYAGSGTVWSAHLRANGNIVTTTILLSTHCVEERNYWGRYYSNLFKVTTAMDDYGNRIWANCIPETGSGAGRPAGSFTPEERKAMSLSKQGDKNPAKTAKSKEKRTGLNHWTKQEKHKDHVHPMTKEENKLKITGKNHVRYNHTVFTFRNNERNIEETLTSREFIIKYNLDQSNVSRLINKRYKQYKGWCVADYNDPL